MNVFEAFNDRLQRRLREMEGEAQHESAAIVSQWTARGRGQSGGRIRAQLDGITGRLHRVIDWAFAEAMKLPGQPFMTRPIAARYLTVHLDHHIDKLYANIGLAGLRGVEKVVNEHRSQSKEALNGELKDFLEGIWHPRNVDRIVPAMNTNNTVNIHGSNQGTVQQGGANSNQQATTFVMVAADVQAALNQFLEALFTSNVDADTKGEMQAEASIIEIHLKRPKPNLTAVQAAVRVIQELAIAVGANVLTPYILPLLGMVGLS